MSCWRNWKKSMARHRRTYNTNLIKKTVSYSTFEIAELFGIHKATVRSWLKQGLKRIDDKRPFLVNGADLEFFLKTKQNMRKRKCQPDELYCCRCRLPQRSKVNKVILKRLSPKTGRLCGLCDECGSRTNRVISLKQLDRLSEIFTIIASHETDLAVLDSPNVNTHLKKDFST